jgi:hypothetical protein
MVMSSGYYEFLIENIDKYMDMAHNKIIPPNPTMLQKISYYSRLATSVGGLGGLIGSALVAVVAPPIGATGILISGVTAIGGTFPLIFHLSEYEKRIGSVDSVKRINELYKEHGNWSSTRKIYLSELDDELSRAHASENMGSEAELPDFT